MHSTSIIHMEMDGKVNLQCPFADVSFGMKPDLYLFLLYLFLNALFNRLRYFFCWFAVLTPLKKGRLSYEKVPGRSDGQTRLKLF